MPAAGRREPLQFRVARRQDRPGAQATPPAAADGRLALSGQPRNCSAHPAQLSMHLRGFAGVARIEKGQRQPRVARPLQSETDLACGKPPTTPSWSQVRSCPPRAFRQQAPASATAGAPEQEQPAAAVPTHSSIASAMVRGSKKSAADSSADASSGPWGGRSKRSGGSRRRRPRSARPACRRGPGAGRSRGRGRAACVQVAPRTAVTGGRGPSSAGRGTPYTSAYSSGVMSRSPAAAAPAGGCAGRLGPRRPGGRRTGIAAPPVCRSRTLLRNRWPISLRLGGCRAWGFAICGCDLRIADAIAEGEGPDPPPLICKLQIAICKSPL